MFHAELIVRIPQMIVFYQNRPELLIERRRQFPRLFDNYEIVCVDEMNKALPDIEKKFRSKIDR